MKDATNTPGFAELELKLQYLQTLAAKVDDHAAYLEAAGKVIGLIPEILAALRAEGQVPARRLHIARDS